MFTARVITVSDSCYNGTRQDLSGEVLERMLEEKGYQLLDKIIVPDEYDDIKSALLDCIEKDVNLILTTGGTGFSKRDVTPEATMCVIKKEAQGIAEAMRANSMTITDKAMLSRARAGICDNSLIINMPGSPKACKECLGYLINTLEHGLEILLGLTKDCARK